MPVDKYFRKRGIRWKSNSVEKYNCQADSVQLLEALKKTYIYIYIYI